jgi:hypothetical protein
MAGTKVSVWAPKVDRGLTTRNRKKLSLGHYAVTGFEDPHEAHSDGRYRCLEVLDSSSFRLSGSAFLRPLIEQYFPTPTRFRQVWNQQRGQRQFFAWKAIPPNDSFVALGMIATVTEDPPPLDCMRCVPKAICQVSNQPPRLVWEDTGTGGRRGSMWAVNSLNSVVIVQGHDPPKETFYDLNPSNMTLNKSMRLEAAIGKPSAPSRGRSDSRK